MILYLFGGSSSDVNREKQQQLILKKLLEIHPRQLLDLWFAITNKNEARRKYIAFKENVESKLPSCQVLDAGNVDDINKAQSPVIFVSGGDSNESLLKAIEENRYLKHLILKSEFYFGSSAGAMIVGSKVREKDGKPLLTGLSILSDTIIEPHYTEWNRKGLLHGEIEEGKCQYGIGIDEACALVVDPAGFPSEYKTLGDGLVEVIET